MPVLAYLDPGSGTLIVQALLGGIAGVTVLFKTMGRRLFGRRSDDDGVDEGADRPIDDPASIRED